MRMHVSYCTNKYLMSSSSTTTLAWLIVMVVVTCNLPCTVGPALHEAPMIASVALVTYRPVQAATIMRQQEQCTTRQEQIHHKYINYSILLNHNLNDSAVYKSSLHGSMYGRRAHQKERKKSCIVTAHLDLTYKATMNKEKAGCVHQNDQPPKHHSEISILRY